MKTYLFTSCWRGALNIANMRAFATKDQVIDHIIASPEITDNIRVYEVSSDQKPKLITREIEKAVEQKRIVKPNARRCAFRVSNSR
jgi:hypothetical protein